MCYDEKTGDVLVIKEEEHGVEFFKNNITQEAVANYDIDAKIEELDAATDLNTTTEANTSTNLQLQPRSRGSPRYLQDYVRGDALSNEEKELQYVALYVSQEDLYTYEESTEENKWRDAIDAEMESIEKNDTWRLGELLVGIKKIRIKWVYKTKINEKGEVDKFKVRLVAKGYSQKHGVDYDEVFAPVAR